MAQLERMFTNSTEIEVQKSQESTFQSIPTMDFLHVACKRHGGILGLLDETGNAVRLVATHRTMGAPGGSNEGSTAAKKRRGAATRCLRRRP